MSFQLPRKKLARSGSPLRGQPVSDATTSRALAGQVPLNGVHADPGRERRHRTRVWLCGSLPHVASCELPERRRGVRMRLGLGQPTIGDDWLILSFAAPVFGGVGLAGGRVSGAGTVLGVTIVSIITQALVLFEIDPFLVQVVLGFLILWAVIINQIREVRMQRSLRRIA